MFSFSSSAPNFTFAICEDENLDDNFLRALLRRQPDLYLARDRNVGLFEKDDISDLAWAA